MTLSPNAPIAANDVHESLGKWILVDGYPFVLDLENSKGAKLVDARTGREYLDFFGCFGSTPIGWNHPALCDQEWLNKVATAVINKPANSDLYTWQMAEYVDAMGKAAMPDGFKYMFFVDGGALAVENALKVAFDWKVRRNRSKGVDSDVGQLVIHFKKAFHGRSGYTLSVTNTLVDKVAYFPKFDTWPRVDAPAIDFDNPDAVLESEKDSLAQIDAAFDQHGDDIACILIEPLQCEGGDRHFRPEYLAALKSRCEKHDCLLIFDEVQTGFFGSGKTWAWEHYGVEPDIFSFGKKSQQCGIMAGSRIDDVPDNCFKTSSRINSTWGGNLVDMMRATKVLEVIESDNLMANAARQGERWIEGMKAIAADFSNVTNVRGLGLIMAFDMPDGDSRNALLGAMMDAGMIGLSSGERTVRFRPHLAITDADTDLCLELTRKALSAL